jgi:LEA14-like dessication related protein
MRRFTILILILTSFILLGGCGKFENIAIHGMKGVKFRGTKNGHILLNITLEIENPNNRKITISKIYFKAWMNNRELGKLRNSKSIVLKANSREEYQVPVEIALRTAADIFKLTNLKDDLLNQLTIEGFIKGRTLCISKRIRIEKQPFSKMVNSYKGKMVSNDTIQLKDTLQAKDLILQNDTLKVE